ncbi:histone H1t [Oryx dammah]|uniref:histone H1t n=1 Tax=Oryx dammah TaxID=59534 RepID=UPI001A9AB6A3|nr:histone H1t [Oryx dammah]
MFETAPAAPADQVPASRDKSQARKRVKKPVGLMGVSRKTASASVSKLITEALSVSQKRAGMSLAALKKALSAAGYDVERNNSRIKLGLKGLVSKGILVQTRGTGASGSFKLSKKAAPEVSKGKVKKPASAKSRKLVLSRDSKSPKNGKANKRAKQPRTTAAQIAARNEGKTKRTKCKQRKSPAQARAGKPETGKPKLTQQKTNTRKATTKK